MTDFIKWPHSTMAKEKDAHLRLLALIEAAPFMSSTDGNGLGEYWFNSTLAGVESVRVSSTATEWVEVRVTLESADEDLVWTNSDNIVPVARHWIGVEGEIPYHLVRDMEAFGSYMERWKGE